MGREMLLELAPFHIVVVCGVAVASIYAAQPVVKVMGRDLDVSAGHAGWIVAIGQFGYLAGLVLLVPLGDVVVDRRRLIAVHLSITVVGMILTASVSGSRMAFVGLAAAGLFAVVVQTTVAYAASVSPPAERGRNRRVRQQVRDRGRTARLRVGRPRPEAAELRGVRGSLGHCPPADRSPAGMTPGTGMRECHPS